jgi:hypothetical protein
MEYFKLVTGVNIVHVPLQGQQSGRRLRSSRARSCWVRSPGLPCFRTSSRGSCARSR